MFPYFPKPIGRYVSQPINSIVRAKDGTIYIPTDSTGRDDDGNGSISAVWATKDEGKTWYDTGGRTAGRHTTIVIAKNGDLLGYGGKNSEINGHMPMARSSDGGKTWKKAETPFDELMSGDDHTHVEEAAAADTDAAAVAGRNPHVRLEQRPLPYVEPAVAKRLEHVALDRPAHEGTALRELVVDRETVPRQRVALVPAPLLEVELVQAQEAIA